jgi:NADH:ubiquinone oxidoreductase subunit E
VSELLNLGSPNERPRAPKADELNLRFSDDAVTELEALKTHYPTLKSCILPALWIAQREYGGKLTGDGIAEVAYRLKRSYAEVQGVATFYTMYNTQHDPGVHKIEVCTCLSCHFNSAYRMRDYITSKLGIKHGETTEDGMFMLEEVECLNACDRAPVVQIIETLRNTKESTVVKLADQIVQVHLEAKERVGELKG